MQFLIHVYVRDVSKLSLTVFIGDHGGLLKRRALRQPQESHPRSKATGGTNHIFVGHRHRFSEPRPYHAYERLDVAQPSDDVSLARSRISHDDGGPVEVEKGVERGEQVTPGPVVPDRDEKSQLEQSRLQHESKKHPPCDVVRLEMA